MNRTGHHIIIKKYGRYKYISLTNSNAQKKILWKKIN
jgi:hypothetical protein